MGWVSVEACATWDHRIAARLVHTDPGDRLPPLNIYGSKQAAVDQIRKGKATEAPIARASFANSASEPKWMAWPIIDIERFEHKGVIHELYKLAFLGAYPEGADLSLKASGASGAQASYSEEQISKFQTNIRVLDVAFVIDATGSMKPYIEAAQQVITDLSKELLELESQPSVQFSLTTYRDYDATSDYVTQHQDLDHAEAFLSATSNVVASAGGDTNEAIFDGIHDALKKTSWRGDQLSSRLIILIGDDPAHEPGHPSNPRNISSDELSEQANQIGVKVFALAIGGESKIELWSQFNQITTATGGITRAIEDVGDVLSEIKQVIKKQTGQIEHRTQVLERLSEGESQTSIQREVGAHEFTEVMEFLKTAGVDPNRLSSTPTFATGWCLGTSESGRQLIQKEIYVARAELEALSSEISKLSMHLGSDFGQNVAALSFAGRVDPRSWFSSDEGPFDIWLAKQGIPTSSGILKLTRADVDHMSESARANLREKILREHLPMLVQLRNDDAVFQTIDFLQWGFVPEHSLP